MIIINYCYAEIKNEQDETELILSVGKLLEANIKPLETKGFDVSYNNLCMCLIDFIKTRSIQQTRQVPNENELSDIDVEKIQEMSLNSWNEIFDILHDDIDLCDAYQLGYENAFKDLEAKIYKNND